jgi:hypothetical protein
MTATAVFNSGPLMSEGEPFILGTPLGSDPAGLTPLVRSAVMARPPGASWGQTRRATGFTPLAPPALGSQPEGGRLSSGPTTLAKALPPLAA